MAASLFYILWPIPMYSLKYDFIFIHVPKTGGNAIQRALSGYAEDRIAILNSRQDGIHRFGLINDFHLPKHATLRQYRQVFGDQQIARFFKFSCIRNPWERVISYYFSPHRGPVEWDREAFVALLEEIKPLSWFICYQPDTCYPLSRDIDFLVRFEHLDNDFSVAVQRLGLNVPRLEKLNFSDRKDYRCYYDSNLVELVGERYRLEVEAGGYSFE